MNNLKLTKRIFSLFPFLIVLSGYVWLIFTKYWIFPVTNDGLDFCFHSAFPWKDIRLFERFFNFYLTKIITLPFHNLLQGCSFASLLYHAGIIIFAFLIARRLAGKIQGFLAAILTALCPFLVVWATEYLTDAPCLFFGLAAFYFSLIGNDHSKNYIKYFLCGFLLTASLFSKFFGVVFIIPVLINIWPHRSLKNFCLFCQGILGVMLFIAICDGYWMNDFFYHLNPKNYLEYIDHIVNAMFMYKSPGYGKFLFTYLKNKELIFYFIIFIVFAVQGVRFLEYRDKFDWRKKGAFSLALAGLSLGIIFTIINHRKPDWYLQYHYNYIIFIPWIIAFCSVLGFFEDSESKKSKLNKSDIISGFLSAFFIIALLTTGKFSSGNLLNSSFERFFSVTYLWIHICTIALVLGAGNYLRNNGYRKITTSLFLIGSFVMIWHSAFWGQDVPEYKRNLHTQTKTFLEKYRELSKSAPVISYDLRVLRGNEIIKTLFLSRLANVEDFISDSWTLVINHRDIFFYHTDKKIVDIRDPMLGSFYRQVNRTAALDVLKNQLKIKYILLPKRIKNHIKMTRILRDIITYNCDLMYRNNEYFLYRIREQDLDKKLYFLYRIREQDLDKKELEKLFVNDSLLKNGSFENWSRGPFKKPAFFEGGDNVFEGMAIREEEEIKVGRYSVKITGENFNFTQILSNFEDYRGKDLTCFTWIKTNVPNKYRVQIYDGIDSSFSKRHSGKGRWELLQTNHKVNPSAKFISTRIIQAEKTGKPDDVVYADGALLVEEEWNSFYLYKSHMDKRNLRGILKAKPVPFFVLTKSENYENLKKEAEAMSLRVTDTHYEYFGCSFFKIVTPEKPLKE